MANRLETFEKLVSTYRDEIASLDNDISFKRLEIKNLEIALVNATYAVENMEVARADQVDQLRGVREVVTKMKITALVRDDAKEDQRLD